MQRSVLADISGSQSVQQAPVGRHEISAGEVQGDGGREIKCSEVGGKAGRQLVNGNEM